MINRTCHDQGEALWVTVRASYCTLSEVLCHSAAVGVARQCCVQQLQFMDYQCANGKEAWTLEVFLLLLFYLLLSRPPLSCFCCPTVATCQKLACHGVLRCTAGRAPFSMGVFWGEGEVPGNPVSLEELIYRSAEPIYPPWGNTWIFINLIKQRAIHLQLFLSWLVHSLWNKADAPFPLIEHVEGPAYTQFLGTPVFDRLATHPSSAHSFRSPFSYS